MTSSQYSNQAEGAELTLSDVLASPIALPAMRAFSGCLAPRVLFATGLPRLRQSNSTLMLGGSVSRATFHSKNLNSFCLSGCVRRGRGIDIPTIVVKQRIPFYSIISFCSCAWVGQRPSRIAIHWLGSSLFPGNAESSRANSEQITKLNRAS